MAEGYHCDLWSAGVGVCGVVDVAELCNILTVVAVCLCQWLVAHSDVPSSELLTRVKQQSCAGLTLSESKPIESHTALHAGAEYQPEKNQREQNISRTEIFFLTKLRLILRPWSGPVLISTGI